MSIQGVLLSPFLLEMKMQLMVIGMFLLSQRSLVQQSEVVLEAGMVRLTRMPLLLKIGGKVVLRICGINPCCWAYENGHPQVAGPGRPG